MQDLQSRFREDLESVARELGDDHPFQEYGWLRNGGRHGGGSRFVRTRCPVFDRAAINVSHVHYDDDPSRPLRSSSALSTIIHPRPPLAPSMHVHISWTERKDGTGYWRMMADLNPSHPIDADTERFRETLRAIAPDQIEAALEQGERYFWIPALQRHRGVVHFYLEGYRTEDPAADDVLARSFGERITDAYVEILRDRLAPPPPTDEQCAVQLAYHTVYFFQVLTLDRGTTSGLLVHDQNDLGIMGSLPSFVDRSLLWRWAEEVPEVQRPLVQALADALPDSSDNRCAVDDNARIRLASAVRDFYRANPAALELQARGDVLPPTISNHGRARDA
ncbi:MAG: coproporphyrinogen III oxidase [Planctomycetota bacterium]